MSDDKERASHMLDQDGKFAQWLKREMEVYLAHNGRDVTLEGFQEHVRKMFNANPDQISQLALDDFATALFKDAS
jgi:predicted ester cyclase